MVDYFSTTTITELLPAAILTLPYLGEINFSVPFVAIFVFFSLTLFFWLLRKVVLKRIKLLASKTKIDFDEALVGAIENIRPWVYSILSLYIALQFFSFPHLVEKTITLIFLYTIVWQTIEIIAGLLNYFAKKFIEKDKDVYGNVDPNLANASNLITLISRIVLWSLGILFVLSNLGIEVTSLLAGLGIGGIAIAFALQGILSDLFASFSIYFDKPFRIGDFIVIGNDSGIVERIGIKTTRIRTLQGEELVISNAELTTVRVQNFKKMQERRIIENFGITYETSQNLVQSVPSIVTRIFEALDGGRLDRVHFTSFGDSALIFEVVYYVESPDYTQYLNIQQAFNFALMKQFSELGINFAYPTQTIYSKNIS